MKTKTKKNTRKYILTIVVVIVASIIVAGAIFSHYGGFGTGECADTKEYAKYAVSVADITIPENTRIVALGEATHGNTEFQKLKLDVFKVLVENYGVRAFTLEGDFGGCEAVNRYINGGEGTAKDAAQAIGFAIYRTEQMEELITWMREYNASAPKSDKLRFYGFDMQRVEYNHKYLLEGAKELGVQINELEKTWDYEAEDFSAEYNPEKRAAIYKELKKELDKVNSTKAEYVAHFADILLQNIELGKAYENDDTKCSAIRDGYMAENINWILEQEEKLGNNTIFVSAHNGHVERFGTYGDTGKVTGNLLADTWGDQYFVIGTDFYETKCNLRKGNNPKRVTKTFFSHDPLAKASWKCGFEESYLDFSGIPEDSPLKDSICEYTWQGSLGEAYSPVMAILPMAYRIWRSPATLYDGMIYVTKAHPIQIESMVLNLTDAKRNGLLARLSQ